tara:strand:+ start:404 stop:841 length:438 start_codon:yes stop_codon:yes gene_type:complete
MAARPLPDRFNWTNNPNDSQSTDDLSFGLSGAATFAADTTTITVSSWPGSNTVAASGDGFIVGDYLVDEFNGYTGGRQLSLGKAPTNVYEIVTITEIAGNAAKLVITPGLVEALSGNTQFYKEDLYKGRHGSAENHLRKRNLGLI